MLLMAATQSTTDGFDFYILGMDSSWVLQYGTYFGGGLSQEHVDGGTSRFDARGKIYQSACAGCGGHDDFPVTPGAWPNSPGNPNHSGNQYKYLIGLFAFYGNPIKRHTTFRGQRNVYLVFGKCANKYNTIKS